MRRGKRSSVEVSPDPEIGTDQAPATDDSPARRDGELPAGRLGARRLGWGIIDQGLSSATNFGLSLLAGRLLGPAGLGTVAIGFSAFVLALVVQRTLVSKPLIVATAGSSPQTRTEVTSLGLTAAVYIAMGASLSVLGLGLLVPGDVGQGLLLVSPWILPALLQDFWRQLLFRDGRGGSAVVNDGAWALAMLAVLPLAIEIGSEWIVVATWGVGATVGAVFGLVQAGVRLGRTSAALTWLRKDAWPFGSWLLVESGVNTASTQIVIFLIASLVGSAAAGGFRAVQAVFMPLTLISPSVALPGLPALVVSYKESPRKAVRLAFKLSAVTFSLTLVYMIVFVAGGGRFLTLLFGSSFEGFEELIFPVALGQVMIAGAMGFIFLLKAAQKTRPLAISRTAVAVWSVLGVCVVAKPYGVLAAAWILTAGTVVRLIVLIAMSLRSGEITTWRSGQSVATERGRL